MSLPAAFLEQTSRRTWITISSPNKPPTHTKCRLPVDEINEILTKRAPEAVYKYESNEASTSRGPFKLPELFITIACSEKARRLAQVLRSNEGVKHSWYLTSNDLFRCGFALAATVPGRREDDGFFVEVWEALDRRLFGKRGRAGAVWKLDLERLRKRKKEGEASHQEEGADSTTATAKAFLRLFEERKSPSEIRDAAEAVARDPAFLEAAGEILEGLYEMEGVVVRGKKGGKGRKLKGKGKEREKEDEGGEGAGVVEEALGEKLEELQKLVEEVKLLRGEEYVG